MRLDLVVGPNGAGKSTFVRLTLAPVLPHVSFVNADLIARQRGLIISWFRVFKTRNH